MSIKTLLATIVCFFIGGNALTAQSQSTSTLYELRTYVSEVGRQTDVLKLIKESGLPMMAKHKLTLVGAWTNVDPKDERVFTLLSHKDKASAEAAQATVQNDPEWKEMLQKSMVDGKRPVASLERIFLSSNDYSPSLNIKDVGNRVFELRTYVATKGNLPALNARFKNHTVALFEKHGMTNILYCSVLDGEKLTATKLLEAVSPSGKATAAIDADLPAVGNSLVYFIAHASPEAAKVNFEKFGADDAWKKAFKDSEASAGGPLTVKDGVKSLFLKPAAFSPIK